MKLKSKKLIYLFVLFIMVMSLISCGNNTEYDGKLNIIEASEVAKVYLEADNIFLIDARGREAYEKGHFEGAICLSPSDLIVSKPIPATIAPKAKVERILSGLGISNDSTIYIYDDNGGVNAGRVWWTLKVYGHNKVMIVNNGSKALLKQDLVLTKKEPKNSKSEYLAKEANPDMIVDFEYVSEVVENPESKVKNN